MTDAMKGSYEQQAEVFNAKADDYNGENYPEFLRRQSMQATGDAFKKRNQYTSDRRRAVERSIQEMIGHSVFEAGAGTPTDCSIPTRLRK